MSTRVKDQPEQKDSSSILLRRSKIYFKEIPIASIKEINSMHKNVRLRLRLSMYILHKKKMHQYSGDFAIFYAPLQGIIAQNRHRNLRIFSVVFFPKNDLFVVVRSGYFCGRQELWDELFCDMRRSNVMVWASHRGLFCGQFPLLLRAS